MSHHCQICDAAIKIDSSLTKLSSEQTKFLLSSVCETDSSPLLDSTSFIPPERLKLYGQVAEALSESVFEKGSFSEDEESNDMSGLFLDVESSDERTKSQLPVETQEQLPDFSKIKTLQQVFSILLKNQDISHPMCAECSDVLTENYKVKFDQSQREKAAYLSFLKKLEQQGQNPEELASELAHVESEYENLVKVHDAKLHELQDLESTEKDLREKLSGLQKEWSNLQDNQLLDLFTLKNELSLDLQSRQRELSKAEAKYHRYLDHLDAVRQYNVYNALFDIQFDQDYGKINGNRLGYKIPWPECNAALGEVAHLLEFLMRKLEIVLPLYKIVPMGSKSYIVKQKIHPEHGKSTSVLELFSSNDLSLGKLFNFNKLDVSMLALVDIVLQVELNIALKDAEFELPYKIGSKGFIGGKSIRVTSNGQWTESCRFLMVDIKWLLSYVGSNA